MTPAQFKQARHDLGLSTEKLARILNTTSRSVRRWEDGSRDPNPTAVRILEWMLDGFRPPQWPTC